MKKLLAVLVAGVTLVACSNNESTTASTEAVASAPVAMEASAPVAMEASAPVVVDPAAPEASAAQ